MKLKAFTQQNLPYMRRSLKPIIGISAKSGTLRINEAAVELMNLKVTDKVVLHQDEEEPENWYLEIDKKCDYAFQLRYSAKISPKGLIFQSTVLVKKIFQSVAFNGISGHLLVGEKIQMNKKEYYTLITGMLRNK